MTATSRKVVSADGTTISCLVSGRGRPLVIMPGTLTVPEMYLPLVESLATRYTVTLVNRRGYGASERGPEPSSVARQAQDLVAVLAGEIEPAVVFGHSFGGLIALSATRELPHRVARLVLYEPPLALLGTELVPLLDACRTDVAQGRPDDAVRRAFAVSGSPDVREDTVPARVVARLSASVAGLLADLECATGLAAPVPEWARISAPVALVRGARSTEPYVRSVELLRAMFPAAPYTILPGQAHFPDDLTLVDAVLG